MNEEKPKKRRSQKQSVKPEVGTGGSRAIGVDAQGQPYVRISPSVAQAVPPPKVMSKPQPQPELQPRREVEQPKPTQAQTVESEPMDAPLPKVQIKKPSLYARGVRKITRKLLGARMATQDEASFRKTLIRVQNQGQLTETLIRSSQADLAERSKTDARLAEAIEKFNKGEARRAELAEKVRQGGEVHPEEFQELVNGLGDVTEVLRDVGIALKVDFPKVIKQFKNLIGDDRLGLEMQRSILSDLQSVIRTSGAQGEGVKELLGFLPDEYNATQKQSALLGKILEKVGNETKDTEFHASVLKLQKTMDSVVLTNQELREFIETDEAKGALEKGLGAVSGDVKGGLLSTLFSAAGLPGVDTLFGDITGRDPVSMIEDFLLGQGKKRGAPGFLGGLGRAGRAGGTPGIFSRAARGLGGMFGVGAPPMMTTVPGSPGLPNPGLLNKARLGAGALMSRAGTAVAGLGGMGSALASTAGVAGAGALGYGAGTLLNMGSDAIINKLTGEDKGLGGLIYDKFGGKSDDEIFAEAEAKFKKPTLAKASSTAAVLSKAEGAPDLIKTLDDGFDRVVQSVAAIGGKTPMRRASATARPVASTPRSEDESMDSRSRELTTQRDREDRAAQKAIAQNTGKSQTVVVQAPAPAPARGSNRSTSVDDLLLAQMQTGK